MPEKHPDDDVVRHTLPEDELRDALAHIERLELRLAGLGTLEKLVASYEEQISLMADKITFLEGEIEHWENGGDPCQ